MFVRSEDIPAITPQNTGSTHVVYVQRMSCDRCGSTKLKTQRSIDNGDKTRTRKMKCKGCGLNFEVVIE